MVNDISGLRYEPALGEVVARRRAALVLMHTRGRSRAMYERASYHAVVDEVLDELTAAAGNAVPPREPRVAKEKERPSIVPPLPPRPVTQE